MSHSVSIVALGILAFLIISHKVDSLAFGNPWFEIMSMWKMWVYTVQYQLYVMSKINC